ncbi:MAG TPA: shikimate kinase [Anaeromyxobacteraceae bacterium]|nr:shikimate kinase [Anaeromyxobacteraceae bacterium]
MSLGSGETVALVGMMGSGKSTVARALSLLLGRRVLASDELVESRFGRPVERVFEEEGEAAFRAEERSVVRRISGPVVADLGGGAFCDPGNAEHLLAVGAVVFLDVSPREAARRLGAGEGRPLAARWEALWRRRLPLYRRATHRVAVDGLSPDAVARRVLGILGAGA